MEFRQREPSKEDRIKVAKIIKSVLSKVTLDEANSSLKRAQNQSVKFHNLHKEKGSGNSGVY